MCAHAEMTSCEPTLIEHPQVQREDWSSAPQYDMYAASGEAPRMQVSYADAEINCSLGMACGMMM